MNNLIVSKFMFLILTAFFCVSLIIIYLPIIVMIVFSFNSVSLSLSEVQPRLGAVFLRKWHGVAVH